MGDSECISAVLGHHHHIRSNAFLVWCSSSPVFRTCPYAAPGAQVQAGAEKLPFPDESFDAAVNVPAARCGGVDFHARGRL